MNDQTMQSIQTFPSLNIEVMRNGLLRFNDESRKNGPPASQMVSFSVEA
jgi:hypothetical protein